VVTRFCLITLLFLIPIILLAQTEFITESDPDRVLQNDFDRFSSQLFSGKIPLIYLGSLDGADLRQNHSFSFRYSNMSAVLHLRKDSDALTSSGNLSLERVSSLLETLSFGNYRFRFGKGLVIGESVNGLSNKILTPGSPYYYQPQGVAFRARKGSFCLGAFLSGQARGYNPSDSLIAGLPKTKTSKLDKTRENLGGVSLEYASKSLNLGILAYRQSYDRAFSDPTLERNLDAVSLCGEYSYKNHTLSAESAWINSSLLNKLDLRLKFPKLTQIFSLARIPEYQIPAYADRQTVLSTFADATEYRYKLDFAVSRHIGLNLASLVYQPRSPFSGITMLKQIICSGAYRDSLNTGFLAVTVFDRKIVQEITDGNYQSVNPIRVRMETRLGRQVSPGVKFDLFLRYHIEDKHLYQSDSWYWNSRLAFDLKPVTILAGIRNWQSMNELLIDQEDQTSPSSLEEIVLPAGQDELRFDLSIVYGSPRIKLSGKGSVSLLTGDIEFSLGLRLAPFKNK